MIFKTQPADFQEKFAVVTAFLIFGDKFLVVQYSPTKKHQPSKWGTPAGKLEIGEERVAGLIRELREETALTFAPDQFVYVDTFYIRYPTFDYSYHMYKLNLSQLPEIAIDPQEHQAYRWVTLDEARKFDLIDDELPCIERVCPPLSFRA